MIGAEDSGSTVAEGRNVAVGWTMDSLQVLYILDMPEQRPSRSLRTFLRGKRSIEMCAALDDDLPSRGTTQGSYLIESGSKIGCGLQYPWRICKQNKAFTENSELHCYKWRIQCGLTYKTVLGSNRRHMMHLSLAGGEIFSTLWIS